MNLTYEIKDNGYVILRDGKPWIVQENGRFPYPGDTVEQSAINHINALSPNNKDDTNVEQHQQKATEERIEKLEKALVLEQQRNERNEQSILELTMVLTLLAGGAK